MREIAPSDEIEVDGLGAESAHFFHWFDKTLAELRGMGSRHNPLPGLLINPAFHPWFAFWAMYRCCDPVRERSLSDARGRLRVVGLNLRTCVSLLKRLDGALAKIEEVRINARLHKMLPDIPAAYSYGPPAVLKLKADLREWQERFTAREQQFLTISNERKSFARNHDDKIGLMCHVRDAAGSGAPGLLAKLLLASFAGHDRDDKDVTTQALINLEKRFKEQHPRMYASLKEQAVRMIAEAAKVTVQQRELFRRRLFKSESATERQEIDQPFLQYIRTNLASNPRFTRHY